MFFKNFPGGLIGETPKARLSGKSFQARSGRVIKALKGRSVGSIERIFGDDCECMSTQVDPGDPVFVGVRFDEEKMVKYILEKVYPSGAPDGLHETLRAKMVDYDEDDGYLFCRDAKAYDDIECAFCNIIYDDFANDVDFYIPSVSDKNFCENFFLCYLELRLDDYRAQKTF